MRTLDLTERSEARKKERLSDLAEGPGTEETPNLESKKLRTTFTCRLLIFVVC